MMRSLELSLGGIEQAVRPDWWVPYAEVKDRVLEKALPIKVLRDKRPDDQALIDAAVASAGIAEDKLVWLPVTSFQSTGWVAMLDATKADIKAFAPVDGF